MVFVRCDDVNVQNENKEQNIKDEYRHTNGRRKKKQHKQSIKLIL